MHHSTVAGMKPAARKCRGSGLRIVVVAAHDDISFGDDFTHGRAVLRDVTHIAIHDAQLARGNQFDSLASFHGRALGAG